MHYLQREVNNALFPQKVIGVNPFNLWIIPVPENLGE